MGLEDTNMSPYGTIAFSQGSVGAMAVWWKEQLVYWTDLRKGTIKRARVPGAPSFLSLLQVMTFSSQPGAVFSRS